MALYIPTTFGASGGGTLIASASTSISGTIGMNSGWPFQQDYFVSNSVTYSYWMWQGVFPFDNTTGSTQNRTSNIATFDIFSGSTLNARLLTIGGGGGAGGATGIYNNATFTWEGNMAVAGGGAGGLVEFNNFPLIPGHYNIIAGAGGVNGISGLSSSITLPIAIAAPFTSSYVVAYQGGRGGSADKTSNAKGVSGASVGGNAQNPGNPDSIISNPVLGAGLGGRSGGDQGRTSGEIPASTPTTAFRATATGGGGFAQSSAASSAAKYITDGGSGSLIQIYPYNYNTASYVATGGGSAGVPGNSGNISQSFTYSQQGNNKWGIGSGGSVSGSGTTDIWGGGDGNFGMVYLEYPYFFNPYEKLATNGLVFRLSQTSLTGSVWYDLSGNANNALISGSTMYTTGSGGSLGWKFNGISNYLTFPISMSAFNSTSQSFTLQWYGTKINEGDVWYHWSGSSSEARGDAWGSTASGQDDWRTYQQANQKTLYTLVQTNFGGTGGSTVAWSRLYINDSIFWTQYDQIVGRNSQPTSAPNIPWQFGYGTQTGSYGTRTYLNGSASDLLFYDRALDVTEVANNYKYFQTLPLVNQPDPFASTSIDYLIVGGGAGGGSDVSTGNTKAFGGGGGGGFISGSDTLSRYTTWPVTVGSGGAVNTNGNSSTFLSLTAVGGGGGNLTTGSNGACGGGGSALSGSPSIQIAYAGGTGSNGMLGASGSLDTNTKPSAGGGGGTLTDGSIGTILVGGAGGSGTLWLDGKYYSAGGGGGYMRGTGILEGAGGTGGNSIGGRGACLRSGTISSTTGSANRGAGGGGGAGTATGSAGGSGVTIIRYAGSGSKATGGTISFSGSYTYHTFTSDGSFSLI